MSADEPDALARRGISESHLAYLVSKINGFLTAEEFEGVHDELGKLRDYVLDGVYRGDYQAPPLVELWQRERATVYAEKPAMDRGIRRLLALQRDVTDVLHAHVAERRRYEGNVVLEWTGSTGFGKSSCMLGFAETHNGLRERVAREGPAALEARLTIDVPELAAKLPHLEAGDCVLMDEQLHLVGEGADTAVKQLRNMEETIRGTGIDVHWASPTTRDHRTSQGLLEAVAWSPDVLRDGRSGRREGLFLLHLALDGADALPLGVVRVPWASPVVWAAYAPIKRRNLERTARMQFHAVEAHDATIRQLFEVPGIQERLRLKRPKKSDWQRYIRRHAPSMSVSEQAALAGELEEMWVVLKDAPSRFERIYGWPPTVTMRRLASGGRVRADEEDPLDG